ncbi:ImmA/IrrE family metallo-endopeptidase [Weissella confusa]|nr:ImmA/IrrE family metallo-endopeptidase [Weissella confusa]
MNPNSSTQYAYEFRLAHELAHLLYGDTESDAVYNFSPYMMRVSERVANVQAIRMIASFWFDDVPVESRNWLDFMNYLGLQSHFEAMVKDSIYE